MKRETTALCSKIRDIRQQFKPAKTNKTVKILRSNYTLKIFYKTFVNHMYTATAKSSSRLG